MVCRELSDIEHFVTWEVVSSDEALPVSSTIHTMCVYRPDVNEIANALHACTDGSGGSLRATRPLWSGRLTSPLMPPLRYLDAPLLC